MTRRRIIAGVILLAAVVVAVPLVPGVWERVAYREELAAEMAYRIKRWEWLPGTAAYVPDQVCRPCRRGRHEGCLMGRPTTEPFVAFFAVPLNGGPVFSGTTSRAAVSNATFNPRGSEVFEYTDFH